MNSALPPPDPNMWFGINETQAVLLAALAAAVFAMWGILSQRDISARQATIQFLRHSERDQAMIDARKKFQELAKSPEGLTAYAAEENAQKDEAIAIRAVLNEYELIAIGIERGVFDDKTHRRWHRSAVVKNWRQAAPFVMALRNRTNNDAIFHEFEEMAKWYRDGKGMPHRRFFWKKYF